METNLSPRVGMSIEGEGPTVVLLHSSMSYRGQWRPLMERLRGRYRLIALDLAGYGDTPFPDHPERFWLDDEVALMASALTEILEPDEPFHLVGHSYGGGVALRLAYDMPYRVSSLALFEPTAFHLVATDDPAMGPLLEVVDAVAEGVWQGRILAATAHFVDYWNGAGAFASLPEGRRLMLCDMLAKVRLDFRALFCEPLGVADYRQRLTMPVCLIAGTRSPAAPLRIAALLAENLMRVEEHRVHGGHMTPLTDPQRVDALIADFLRRLDGTAECAAPGPGRKAMPRRRLLVPAPSLRLMEPSGG